MNNLFKISPLNYRILIEKIDSNGNKIAIHDTGFIHISEETKNKIQLLLDAMKRDSEFKDMINKIRKNKLEVD